MSRRAPRRPVPTDIDPEPAERPRLLKFRVWNGSGTVNAVIGVCSHAEVRRERGRRGSIKVTTTPRTHAEIIEAARQLGRSTLSLRHTDAIVVEPLDTAE